LATVAEQGAPNAAMAALYDRYAGLFLHTNAAFLCERAHAEAPSSQTLEALAACYLRQGAAHRAYATLRGQTLEPHGRYLLALSCHRLDLDAEAEAALLPDRAARSAGPRESAQLLRSAQSPVPHGAAGLHVLGAICEKCERPRHAIAYYELALERDALMWVSYDALCRLGADVDPHHAFRRGAPHALHADPLPHDAEDENAPPARTPRALAPTPPSAPSTRRPKALSFASTPASPPPEPRRAKVPRTEERRGTTPAQLPRALLDTLRILGSARRDLATSNTDACLRALHALPARQFDTGWAQHLRGRAHFERADYDACVHALNEMRRYEPHRLEGVELLSTALWHLKDDVALCALARDATKRDNQSPQAWCAAGNCLSLQKEHDAAIRCFHRAIGVNPRFAYAYTLCGHEYVANEAFDKAVSMYRHAMRLDGRHYNAWYGLGAIYYRQEKYALAEYHFQRALSMNPGSSVLHCYLGMTYHANGRCHDALRHLRKAAKAEPANPQARFQCANVLISMDRHAEALEELEKVADHAPREASVHFFMGKVCKKLGKLDEAMMRFTFALDLEPKDNNLIKSAIDRLEEPDISEDEKF
jgi:anaphase-promoting complex subunit 3